MNQRVVLGVLIAGGLGIGLFAAVERMMRGAGRQVVKIAEPEREPVEPLTIVSTPVKKPEAPRAVQGEERSAFLIPPAGMIRGIEATLPTPAPLKLPKGAPVVEKLAVCMGVKDRNPVGETTSVAAGTNRVYCWMRVTGGSGKKVRPMWTLNGKSVAGTWIVLGSNAFRTWTTKKIDAACVGAAKLEIQDEKGRTLAVREFEVVAK